MPSDERMDTALRALAGPIEKYRSAVITAAEEVRGYLSSHASKGEGDDESVAAGLGRFAAGVIDVDRFSSLLENNAAAGDPATLEKVEGAYKILSDIAVGGDDVFRIELRSGARLRDAIGERWAEIGRAFAAARVAGMATVGSLNSRNDKLLGPLSFERWNRAERQLAPPLVVELEGADLHAGDLAEFLDGKVKIALVVKGEAPPAPLVRLITPATFVLQTDGATGLDRFGEFDGPAVAALVPEGCARFVHDPDRGPELWERIEVAFIPEAVAGHPIGGLSTWQMAEELHQLRSLQVASAAAAERGDATAAGGVVADSPVDKLAAWLLSQADLDDLGRGG